MSYYDDDEFSHLDESGVDENGEICNAFYSPDEPEYYRYYPTWIDSDSYDGGDQGFKPWVDSDGRTHGTFIGYHKNSDSLQFYLSNDRGETNILELTGGQAKTAMNTMGRQKGEKSVSFAKKSSHTTWSMVVQIDKEGWPRIKPTSLMPVLT